MAGGNGLAICLMVLGFIVLFLVPLAFLTSLF
jgi:energy-converting hydrogenase Eha subunit G